MRATWRLLLVAGFGAIALAVGCDGGGQSTLTPTPTASTTPSATATSEATSSPTATPTATPTPTPTATPTPAASSGGQNESVGVTDRVTITITDP